MYCLKQITRDLTWVGGNDRRLAMFEGVYSVPRGVSYNSYLLTDEKTVLLDTVDKAVGKVFFENVEHALNGRTLDYVILQHMEPDHSATLEELIRRYPDATIVCSAMAAAMIGQFFGKRFPTRVVKEGETLDTGRHTLRFIMAPMIHWPEVMMTYDDTDGILFSADAFGCFGALNGAIFAHEVDFMRDYLDEARRYYCNIVGKYGAQVQSLLKKAAGLTINMICPLHGFVWQKNIGDYVHFYDLWSSYTPEETGVMIAYASVYGNTENAAELLSSTLRARGIKSVMFDVSVTPASEIVAEAFRFSHLVFASTTYNAGVFVTMDELLRDLAAHNLQKRTVAFIQNGSWAPVSGGLMRDILSGCRDMRVLDETLSIKSALSPKQLDEIEALADAIQQSMPAGEKPAQKAEAVYAEIDEKALFTISYGLYILSAKEGEKDNACVINTAQLVTSQPNRISICVNKKNRTHDMIHNTGVFNVSILTTDAPFSIFQRFGFQSGRDADKFAGFDGAARAANGLVYLKENANAFISGRVQSEIDMGTHTLFVAEVTQSARLGAGASLTYAYYFAHVKPKAPVKAEAKGRVWVCQICGYEYDEAKEGVPFEELPADWTCPLCKHPKSDFEVRQPAPEKPKGRIWVCQICGYEYDEAKEGVPFEELPADWTCPLCKHPKSDFALA